jgi:hypothetical protein
MVVFTYFITVNAREAKLCVDKVTGRVAELFSYQTHLE